MRPAFLAALPFAALMVAVVGVAQAQGFRRVSPEAVAERIEQLGQLDPALDDIDLTKEQEDSLERIEEQHQQHFTDLAEHARTSLAGSGSPDRAALMEVVDSGRALRDAEWSAARAALTPEQQVTFDKNVAEIRERAAERAARMREMGAGRG